MKHPCRFSLARFLGAIAVAFLIAWPANAQEHSGSIQGTVQDSSGGVLPGVTVEAKGAASSTNSVSNAAGKYRFPALPPGRYSVTANLSGFSPATVGNIELALGQSKTVDLTLALAGVAAEVKVTGEAPLIDVTQSARFVNIREDQIQKLPKGRDFTSLVTQAPGAVAETKAGGISIDGSSGSENRFIIDGIETTHIIVGTSGKGLITDFVDEVQVKSSGYAAEFGGATGGVINVITKSGTNEWKGDVGLYYSNSGLNGDVRPTLRRNLTNINIAEYITFPKDDFDRIEPGFSLGGALIQDRLWTYTGYQPAIVSLDRSVLRSQDNRRVSRTQDTTIHNGTANLTAQFTDRVRGKLAFNLSSSEVEGLLPTLDGTDAATTDYDVTTKFPDYTLSGSLDLVATNNLYFGLRGGYYFSDAKDEGIFQGDRILYLRSAVGRPGVPPEFQLPLGYATSANTERRKDEQTRLSLQGDGTVYFSLGGEHALKAGVQWDRIGNDVDTGETGQRVRVYWGSSVFGQRGEFGHFRVRSNRIRPQEGFLRFGDIDSDNIGLFFQDSWTIGRRLTLNVGVRTEQEKVPSFSTLEGQTETAIEFDFEDKLAPRFGFAWDILGDQKWKAYGSWGIFYDVTKLEMPRGSFGGEYWWEWYFRLDNPNPFAIATGANCPPTCPGGARIAGPIDFRHPSNDPKENSIDPDIEPMELREWVAGIEHELSPVISVGARYVHKEIETAIEDIGTLDAQQNEIYTIGNPGKHLATFCYRPLNVRCPEAVRDYDGFEVSFNKRPSNRWGLRLSYLYSKLEGNYSGLANSDENGRTSPNVNRVFDYPIMAFNEKGKAVFGVLATDRPHQGKMQFLYDFPFGTSIGLNGYVASGIPISREVAIIQGNEFPVQVLGRNSDGRTPTFSQADLYAQHEIKFGGMGVVLSVNVLNLFDQDTATDKFKTVLQPGQALDLTEDQFFRGFNTDALIARDNLQRDPRFLQESSFQAPRSIRLGAKFLF